MALEFFKRSKKRFAKEHGMIFYLSGGEIEETLKDEGITGLSLMLSFFVCHSKPSKRFLKIVKSRKKERKERHNASK